MSVESQAQMRPNAPQGSWRGHAVALAMVALAAAAAVLVDQAAEIPNLSLVFVLPVVIAAAVFGWGPALTAVAGGVLAFNFLLIEPRYTLRVEDAANAWALILLLGVAAIVSAVAAESRRRAVVARQSADQAQALQGLARALVVAPDRAAILTAAAEALGQFFDAPAVVLADAGEGLSLGGASGAPVLDEAELEAAAWTLAARLPTRSRSYPLFNARFDFWPVLAPPSPGLVIGVDFGPDGGRPVGPERLVEAVGGYLTMALERARYARQALEADVRHQGEQLKADLLAAVSHDLKTPLSTILFTLQSLQKFDAQHEPGARAELLAVAEAETARLSGLVANLLNMSRLDADATPVTAGEASMADLAASALARAGAGLGGHPVESRVDPAAPPVWIDYALAETALANVLENAGKYSPPGSPILIRSAPSATSGVIEVLDEGPGFPAASARLFEKFERGVQGDGRPPGTGLGLAIARGFLEAQGGAIEALCRPDRQGALVRVSLPLAQPQAARP